MTKRSDTPKQRAKAAEIYRKAAQGMEADPGDEYHTYTCVAVMHHANWSGRPLAERYAALFGTGLPPYCNAGETPETSLQGAFARLSNAERQDVRILALCFMAAIVERP